ncbi:phosphoribosylpyrophosphate synthetase, partial [Streptococcus pneumoniae]
IMELLQLLDAAKRASPSEIIVVLPYYGYARQDKKEGKHHRGPIGAKLVADLINTAAGRRFTSVIAIDLHAEAIEGFFDVG